MRIKYVAWFLDHFLDPLNIKVVAEEHETCLVDDGCPKPTNIFNENSEGDIHTNLEVETLPIFPNNSFLHYVPPNLLKVTTFSTLFSLVFMVW